MLDFSHIPTPYGNADVQVFTGDAVAAGTAWKTWIKPRGKSMLNILLIGKGGNGGTAPIAGNSLAAGGGGGGSGAMTSLTIPMLFLPNILYLSLAGQSSTTTLASYVAIQPVTTANTVVTIANGGGNGGNASGNTGGTAGTAGAIATAATMPFGWQWANLALAGQAGIVGATATGNAGSVVIPVTGLIVTSGGGGAGLPATATVGRQGGGITGAGIFPSVPVNPGGSADTTPPTVGFSGFNAMNQGFFGYGGTGGGSTHGSATGAGLVQASGGNGYYGCGGGGMGGALTGSTAGVVGQGGPAIAIFTCW